MTHPNHRALHPPAGSRSRCEVPVLGREEGETRIGELAARSGVSVRSLRYYDEQGLLVSTRSTELDWVMSVPFA